MASASQSLSSLLARTTLNDHEEVLRAANGALKKSRTDLEAQQARATALIKLDRYDEALRIFDEGGDRLKERARLAYAYALYKAGNLDDAERIAGGVVDHRGMKHVEAQATYRAERFARAAELYQQLAGDGTQPMSEQNDIRINSGATDAQLEWAGQGELARKRKPGREDLEAFETAFNAACGSIARGELGQGEVLLRRAKELCSLSEELTEEEKAAELLPIMVQQVYVLARQGRLEEAEKLCSSIDVASIFDASTRRVARVNTVAVSTQHSNPYLSQRLFQSTPAPPKNDQLFHFQSRILHEDELVTNLQCMKYAGVEKTTSSYLSRQSLPSISAEIASQGVFNAAAHAHCQTDKSALKQILPILEKRPNDVGLLLTILQLYVLNNNHGSAIALLESFLKRLEESTSPDDQDVRFAPGLVGTLVSLYSLQGRSTHIRTELSKAASYWRHRYKGKPDTPTGIKSLLKVAAARLLDSPHDQDLSLAGEIFSDLCSQNPDDRFSVAGFVAANATTSPSSITPEQIDTLTSTARLTMDIDAAALEEAGVARPPAARTTPATGDKRKAEEAPKTKKPNKIPKNKMPKDFDPNRTMDPERWLPLRDRSTYRPKGRKGKQKAADRTQGGVVNEEGSRPETPSAGVVTAGGAAGGGVKGKKKGKGGKR